MNFSIDLNKLNESALEGVLSHWCADNNWSILREVCVNPKMQASFCKVMENVLIYCTTHEAAQADLNSGTIGTIYMVSRGANHNNLRLNTVYPNAYAQLTSKSLNDFRLEILDKITPIERESFMVKWWGNISSDNAYALKRTGFAREFLDEGWCSPTIIKALGASKSKTACAWLSWRDSQEIKKWSKEKIADRWEIWHEYYDVTARGAFAKWVVRAPITSEERAAWLKKICDTPVAMQNEMKFWWETEMPKILAQGSELKPDEVSSFNGISREFVINFIYNLLKTEAPEIEKTLPWIEALGEGNLAYHPKLNYDETPETLYWSLASRGDATVLNALMAKGYKPRQELIAPAHFNENSSKNCYKKMPWIMALAWANGAIDEKVAEVFMKTFPNMLSEALALNKTQLLKLESHQTKISSNAKVIKEYEYLDETLKVQKILSELNLRQIAFEGQAPIFSARKKI